MGLDGLTFQALFIVIHESSYFDLDGYLSWGRNSVCVFKYFRWKLSVSD